MWSPGCGLVASLWCWGRGLYLDSRKGWKIQDIPWTDSVRGGCLCWLPAAPSSWKAIAKANFGPPTPCRPHPSPQASGIPFPTEGARSKIISSIPCL